MIGPRDTIDKRLVQMYANVQTCNFDQINKINTEDMMKGIELMSRCNKIFIDLNNKKSQKIA